jgi:hypothetical protein
MSSKKSMKVVLKAGKDIGLKISKEECTVPVLVTLYQASEAS